MQPYLLSVQKFTHSFYIFKSACLLNKPTIGTPTDPWFYVSLVVTATFLKHALDADKQTFKKERNTLELMKENSAVVIWISP
jgi:hypothetical protein